VVDAGPAALAANHEPAVNTAFVSVVVCIPGSNFAAASCQTVDHVEVDTGSVGLRILADEVSTAGAAFTLALPPIKDSSGNLLAECLTFADGASWGTLATADIELPVSTKKALSVPVQIIGSAAAGTPPAACTPAAPLHTENTVPSFGANGILGVGPFINDCNSNSACSPPTPGQAMPSAVYYSCPSNPCNPSTAVPASASLAQQVANPVTLFGADKNGVILELPAVGDAGAANPSGGVLVFGIGTQSNNGASSATVLPLDANGEVAATLNNSLSYTMAFLDSGSNGNFFADSALTVCTDNQFFCPANPPVPQTVVLSAANAKATAMFNVGNADAMFLNTPGFTALPDLAGTNMANVFDLGLPFFFGRKVYTGFETNPGGAYFAF
jgi:hypothetical protein